MRDIKGQVFSIQEGERGFRSDKLSCKQAPQILPAGGSPPARGFVYQSAPIVLRGQRSGAPSLPTLNHKIEVIISSHPHQHLHLSFPVPPFSSFCFLLHVFQRPVSSSFTSSSPPPPVPPFNSSCFVLGKTLFFFYPRCTFTVFRRSTKARLRDRKRRTWEREKFSSRAPERSRFSPSSSSLHSFQRGFRSQLYKHLPRSHPPLIKEHSHRYISPHRQCLFSRCCQVLFFALISSLKLFFNPRAPCLPSLLLLL